MRNPVLEQLEKQRFQLFSSKQSQNFGRLIFRSQHTDADKNLNADISSFGLEACSADASDYWLKLQLIGHVKHQAYFMHELAQYQRLSDMGIDVLLPYTIVPYIQFDPILKLNIQKAYDLTLEELELQVMPQTLVLVDSFALFDVDPWQLTEVERTQRLIHSLEVLEKLHQHHYVHGDLKPEHFRRYQEKTYLIDFEQGGFVNERKTMENSATPRYMAPELFHAEQKSIESDIYALGIIWFEWLTQEKIKKNSYLDWAKWHCQHFNVQFFSGIEDLHDILQEMLTKNKVNRCTNIYQIKQRLSNFV